MTYFFTHCSFDRNGSGDAANPADEDSASDTPGVTESSKNKRSLDANSSGSSAKDTGRIHALEEEHRAQTAQITAALVF